jgi:enediyne core biosynthesis thioesterase
MRSYEYRHVVSFEETNLVGNVYYTHQLSWQGRCRELFLKNNAPDIIDGLGRDFTLATVRCACEYLAELMVFDEVSVRMHLVESVQNRITLGFEYWRLKNGSEELVARGEQQVACMRRDGERMVPAPVPASLREALAPYSE